MPSLESAIAEFRGLLAAGLPAKSGGPATRDEWTREQILGHLIDSAANNHHRFVRAQIESDFAIPEYAQEQWVEVQQYRDRPWEELVALWTAYNRQLLWLMERLPAEKRAASCRVGTGQPATLEFVMVDYIRHLKHHLEQIRSR